MDEELQIRIDARTMRRLRDLGVNISEREVKNMLSRIRNNPAWQSRGDLDLDNICIVLEECIHWASLRTVDHDLKRS